MARCEIEGCSWPDTPHTCVSTRTRCTGCGWPVDEEILADAPACPHGWVDLTGMAMADIKALFARTDSDLDLTPGGAT